jgi:RNase P subunit RPR2
MIAQDYYRVFFYENETKEFTLKDCPQCKTKLRIPYLKMNELSETHPLICNNCNSALTPMHTLRSLYKWILFIIWLLLCLGLLSFVVLSEMNKEMKKVFTGALFSFFVTGCYVGWSRLQKFFSKKFVLRLKE